MPITNAKMIEYSFLADMYDDDYFPDFLVDKCKGILVHLCEQVESSKPSDIDSLFKLTHAAVDGINKLGSEFEENDSELETGARESLAEDFGVILDAYGFGDAGLEDAIANRDW